MHYPAHSAYQSGLHNLRNCAQQENSSCLDSELPGTGLWRGADAGPGQPNLEEKSQLEPSRDGGDMRKGKEEPIRDVA